MKKRSRKERRASMRGPQHSKDRTVACPIHGIAPKVGVNRCLTCYREARRSQRQAKEG